MYRSIEKWIVPVVVLAGIASVLYMSQEPSSNAAASATVSSPYPNLWLQTSDTSAIPASVTSQQHELAALKDQLRKNPNHTPVLLRMSEVARGLGKTTESIDYLTQAAAADPDNAETRLELGRELFEAGNVDKAIQETKKILEKKPRYVDALYNLGAMYGNLGQDDIARQYFARAVEADPISPSGQKAKKGLEVLTAAN